MCDYRKQCGSYDAEKGCDEITSATVFCITPPLTAQAEPVAKLHCCDGLCDAADYAYKDIAEFEGIVEYKVNESFRAGWTMARTTNKQLGILAGEEEGT